MYYSNPLKTNQSFVIYTSITGNVYR